MLAADHQNREKPSPSFAHRVLVTVGIVGAALLLLFFLRATISVLLLIFAGILLSVLLHGLAKRLAEHTPLSHGWALGIVILLIVSALGLGGWLIAPELARQTDQLSQTIPQSLDAVQQTISEYTWGAYLLKQAPAPDKMLGSGDVWSRLTGFFSTSIGIIGNTLIIIGIGIYLSINPSLYQNGVALLFPERRRPRVHEVLKATGGALWSWLGGQLISMAIVGTLTGVGLMLLGVPMALALGIIAGLSEFVPLIGPWVGAVPGILIALVQSPNLALYTAALYLGVQQIESNLITPIVMKKAVSLPPALTISATILAGALFGIAGVLLATPLAVATMVLIRMVYIHDLLGDEDVEPVP